MKRFVRPGWLVVAALAIYLAGGGALAAGLVGARAPFPPCPKAACSTLACRAALGLKNLLLDGVHLGQRGLHEAIRLALDSARQVTEDAMEAPAEGLQGPRPSL